MSDISITDLIAEARGVAGCRGCSLHGPSVMHRLADALESVTAPTRDEQSVVVAVKEQVEALRSMVNEGLTTPDVAAALGLVIRSLDPIITQSSADAMWPVTAPTEPDNEALIKVVTDHATQWDHGEPEIGNEPYLWCEFCDWMADVEDSKNSERQHVTDAILAAGFRKIGGTQ